MSGEVTLQGGMVLEREATQGARKFGHILVVKLEVILEMGSGGGGGKGEDANKNLEQKTFKNKSTAMKSLSAVSL